MIQETEKVWRRVFFCGDDKLRTWLLVRLQTKFNCTVKQVRHSATGYSYSISVLCDMIEYDRIADYARGAYELFYSVYSTKFYRPCG